MRELIKYKLNFYKAKIYFEEILKDGNTLCEFILKMNDFRRGDFYTLLTKDANINQIYEFKQGGILPSFPEKKIHISSLDETFTGEKVNSIDQELANYINQILNKNKKNSCIFEDVTQSPTDPHINFFKSNGILYRNEIYYLITQEKNNYKTVSEAIRESYEFWHFLSIITSVNFNDIKGKKLTLKKIKDISSNLRLIIIGAYDGEGYIFWEKNIHIPDQELGMGGPIA